MATKSEEIMTRGYIIQVNTGGKPTYPYAVFFSRSQAEAHASYCDHVLFRMYPESSMPVEKKLEGALELLKKDHYESFGLKEDLEEANRVLYLKGKNEEANMLWDILEEFRKKGVTSERLVECEQVIQKVLTNLQKS